jgi:hypothetical protein
MVRPRWLFCTLLQAVPLQLFDVNGGPAGPNEHDQKQVRCWVEIEPPLWLPHLCTNTCD